MSSLLAILSAPVRLAVARAARQPQAAHRTGRGIPRRALPQCISPRGHLGVRRPGRPPAGYVPGADRV